MQTTIKGLYENINQETFRIMPDGIVVEKGKKYRNSAIDLDGSTVLVEGDLSWSQEQNQTTIKPTTIYKEV